MNLKPPGSIGGLTAHSLTIDGRFSMKTQELRGLQPPPPPLNSKSSNSKNPIAAASEVTSTADDYIVIQ
jgi:hypothetical protein